MKEILTYLVQAGWRYATTAAFGAAWMYWGSWEDRPWMQPVALVFALLLSAAVGLAIAGDTHEKSELRSEIKLLLASNQKLIDSNTRLRYMTPPGGTPAIPASLGNVPVPRRDPEPEEPKHPGYHRLGVFNLKRFQNPPAIALEAMS